MLTTWGTQIPQWVLQGAAVDLFFSAGVYFGGGALTDLISVSRASQETSLLPTSASGASYSTFANNVAAVVPDSGLQIYQSATNFLLNSTAPATQTTGSLGTGSYTLWVNGSGSATVSAGTATITGAGTATNGAPLTFSVTVAGTVVVTKSGSLNAFQLEAGTFGTPLIVTAGATASRAGDVITAQGALATAIANAKSARIVTNSGAGIVGGAVDIFIAGGTNFPNFGFGSTTTVRTVSNSLSAIATIGNSGNYSGLVKSAYGFDSASMTAVANGGTKVTSANAWTTPSGTLYIGSNAGSNGFMNGYLLRATFGPTKGMFDAMTTGSNLA